MDAPTGDRGDGDHYPLGGFELCNQPARQHDGREEVDLEHVLPILKRRLDGAEAAPTETLGRDAGIVDKRIEPRALGLEPLAHLANGAGRVLRIGKVDL